MATLITPHLFLPEVIRNVVQTDRPGVYVLGNDKNGFQNGYVGRSDTCLRRRLLTHNYLYEYEYFIFIYTKTPQQAFWLESQWWHNCQESGISNFIHPASPSGSGLECPYCHFAYHVKNLLVS
ncbi:hypothetical protein [Lysinibacillus fusiformis]|uniref:hypothetical protein n=1 Tax=Lysinibacillus fusiformis TaxID=28031 RepID=UPI00187FC639|nr:hypothetical protein [Lysinibacillus fusiformis]MBD8522362.1 hypothetical protein [Lysinibacillus fusiformis]